MNSYQKKLSIIIELYKNALEKAHAFSCGNSNLTFKTANIVGEYAEIIASISLGLKRNNPSAPCIDGIDDKGKTYQIKSRWVASPFETSGKNEFGQIKKLVKKYKSNETIKVEKVLDFIVFVVFTDSDLSQYQIYKLPVKNIDEIIQKQENGDYSKRIIKRIFSGPDVVSYKFYYDQDVFEKESASNTKLIELIV